MYTGPKQMKIPHHIMSKSVCQRPYEYKRGVEQMLTKDDEGVSPKMTIADEGGRGGLEISKFG